jgi:hypothetical protein
MQVVFVAPATINSLPGPVPLGSGTISSCGPPRAKGTFSGAEWRQRGRSLWLGSAPATGSPRHYYFFVAAAIADHFTSSTKRQ